MARVATEEVSTSDARVELGSIDLSQVAPTEYRADAEVILHDLADRLSMATSTRARDKHGPQ